MTLKVRLAAMMIALLVAVMAAQYLLMQREQRDITRRIERLSREIDESTRRFSEGSRVLAAAVDSTEIEAVIEWLNTPGAHPPPFVQEMDGEEHVFIHEDDSTKIEIRAIGRDPGALTWRHRTTIAGPDSTARLVREEITDAGVLRVYAAGHHDPGSSDGRVLEMLKVNLPLPGEGEESGRSLQLVYPMDGLTEELARARRRSWIWLAGLLGAGATGAVMMAVQFTRPIRSLQSSFGRVVDGDLSVEVAPERPDEIGKLTGSFNEMVVRLRETREMESRLGEAERLAAIGRLAAGVAHEIRNPLNAMLLTLQQLGDKTAPAPGTAERESFDRYARLVTSELERLERLVSTFLDLSRSGEAARDEVNIAGGVRASVELFAPEAAAKGVALAAEVDPEISVEGDRERLPTVWNNLVANALQATDAGGKVSVRARATDDGARIEVADDGEGIDTQDVSRIWEPFWSGRADGTGLGLSLVRSIVEQHGGRVAAESEKGRGTTVTVILPRRRPERT